MKLFITLILIIASNSLYAGTCSKATLKGAYSFNFNNTRSHTINNDPSRLYAGVLVGRAKFSNGTITVNATGSTLYNIVVTNFKGSGTYAVNGSCIATGTIVWSDQLLPTEFKFYLDSMDTGPAINLAYHAFGIMFEPSEHWRTWTGELNRSTGKF